MDYTLVVYNAGDQVRLFGDMGIFNKGVVIEMNIDTEMVLVKFSDLKSEWIYAGNLVFAERPE